MAALDILAAYHVEKARLEKNKDAKKEQFSQVLSLRNFKKCSPKSRRQFETKFTSTCIDPLFFRFKLDHFINHFKHLIKMKIG